MTSDHSPVFATFELSVQSQFVSASTRRSTLEHKRRQAKEQHGAEQQASEPEEKTQRSPHPLDASAGLARLQAAEAAAWEGKPLPSASTAPDGAGGGDVSVGQDAAAAATGEGEGDHPGAHRERSVSADSDVVRRRSKQVSKSGGSLRGATGANVVNAGECRILFESAFVDYDYENTGSSSGDKAKAPSLGRRGSHVAAARYGTTPPSSSSTAMLAALGAGGSSTLGVPDGPRFYLEFHAPFLDTRPRSRANRRRGTSSTGHTPTNSTGAAGAADDDEASRQASTASSSSRNWMQPVWSLSDFPAIAPFIPDR